ncbi:MAG TPA: hypothetical protein PLL02_05200 [Bacteroidales bacterium]|jgi:hypothetical protein|nr:hypothetical protein [Bacteroidales bacterium]
MEYIISVLILFILLNVLLKLSFWRWWQVALFSALLGLFVLLVTTYAAEQSKAEITAWLSTPAIMQNVAVLITLETVVFVGFAFMRLRQTLGTKVKKYLMLPLNVYPGLLLLPVLYFVLAQLFYALPGVSFNTISYGLAIAVFILFPLLSWGFTKLLPEEDLRLEILFIVNLIVCMIGLITTVNGETAYAPVERTFNIKAILFAVALFLVLFIIGYFWDKYRKIKIK